MSSNPNPSLSPRPQQATLSPQIQQTNHSPRSTPAEYFDSHSPPQDEDEEPPYEDADAPYPEPTSEQTLLPPPNFNPFFHLIEDSTTGEHYHPYVHYIFADDDPVIITAAAMRSLGLDETRYLPVSTPEHEHERPLHSSDPEEALRDDEEVVHSPLPPPIPGAKERYMIIDVGLDGHTIVNAQSLSAEWQITNTSVRSAPSFDEDAEGAGLMLSIEGVEIPKKNKGKSTGGPGEMKWKEARETGDGDVFKALDGLVKGVEGGLKVAAKIKGTTP
jgi:hypothetical protein